MDRFDDDQDDLPDDRGKEAYGYFKQDDVEDWNQQVDIDPYHVQEGANPWEQDPRDMAHIVEDLDEGSNLPGTSNTEDQGDADAYDYPIWWDDGE